MVQDEVRSRGRVFYGWWVVTAASVGLFVGFGPVITFTFGIFFNAMTKEFHWSRSEFSRGESGGTGETDVEDTAEFRTTPIEVENGPESSVGAK